MSFMGYLLIFVKYFNHSFYTSAAFEQFYAECSCRVFSWIIKHYSDFTVQSAGDWDMTSWPHLLTFALQSDGKSSQHK